MSHSPLSRRAVLRGLGTAVALPWLEAMTPTFARGPAAGAAGSGPLRMAFFYVPNGVHMESWRPPAEGVLKDLPETLAPLAKFKDDLLVLSGLAQETGEAGPDGPGDHARALSTFLTGCRLKKTDGADIKVGRSVDQVAADRVGKATRFASLELGTERGGQAGNCDSGYSCAYSSNISWRTESQPMAKEVNPRLVFDRLFGSGGGGAEFDASRARRDRYRKSILDFAADDARQLSRKLGSTDRRKLDEYLSAVREIEGRLQRAEARVDLAPGFAAPQGIPEKFDDHVKIMGDLIALAFQADQTRIVTFMYANETSGRSYPDLGVPEGHHDLSHHGGDAQKHEKLRKIDRFHIEQFASILEKLRSIKEGDSNLLDRSMIVYGSGISDGDRHNHDDLPVLLLGKGNGTIKPGRHLKFKDKTPLNNLYLSMLDRMGAPVGHLGDSTGKLGMLQG